MSRLPTVKLKDAILTIDFRLQELRFMSEVEGLEILPFYKFESQLVLEAVLGSGEGKEEFKRYRDECLYAGDSIDHLELYENYVFGDGDWKPHAVRLPIYKNITVNFEKGGLIREGENFRLDSQRGVIVLKDLFQKPEFVKEISRYERECLDRNWSLNALNHYKKQFVKVDENRDGKTKSKTKERA